MRVVVQRVKKASVTVNNKQISKIDNGLALLVGFTIEDTEADIDYIVKKVLNLRIFDDENHIMNKSILNVEGEILSVSQFTLYADTKKGNRPSYNKALKAEKAIKLYQTFNDKLKKHIPVKEGIFGEDMLYKIENDGPVTIILESRKDNDKSKL